MLKGLKKILLIAGFIGLYTTTLAQKGGSYHAIYSGTPWFDEQGKVVSAHGANIVKDNNRFYMFGEAHSDTSNAFVGFNCYSSEDLQSWKFESIALPQQVGGKLGPNRVGERPKVLKCPKTGEYIMYMHVDTLGYKDQFVGYATSSTITGPYTFQGPLLFNGKAIRKWDMGAFQDKDGSGYVLLHGGDIYKLSDDYKSITDQVNSAITSGFESPAILRKDDIYYFLGSDLTSWEKNDNYYYTATSLKGPWTKRGFFCPPGTLTWNSQTTFVLPVVGSKDTTYMFMGDRWSFPKQASAATYVWQPLTISGNSLSIPKYYEAWKVDLGTGSYKAVSVGEKAIDNTDRRIVYSGSWKQTKDSLSSSDKKNDSFVIKFKGTQLALYGLSRPDGGYANIELQDLKGKVLLSTLVDMYCKYPFSSLKYLTPVLPKGKYQLVVQVTGERPNWSDKKRTQYGSTGYFVSFDKAVVKK